MNYTRLSQSVAEHVIQFYLQHPDNRLFYHNLNRAIQIVESVNKINAHDHSDEQVRFITTTAAWFSDTGIVVSGPEFYKAKSSELAKTFLKTLEVADNEIAKIADCILCTDMPLRPLSLAEQIVCDADQFYLGTEDFLANIKLARKEMDAFSAGKIAGNTWRQQTISLLENHSYHTSYCQLLLNETKAHNLNKFKVKHELKSWKGHHGNAHILPDHNEIALSRPAAGSKNMKYHLRGVETMFRNSSSNHQHLSMMADNKAFIMISVNSIIISVAIGLIIGKFVVNSRLIIPTILLLCVNVLTIIYSVLATRPAINKGTFTREQVMNKSVNLLFFGSFYKMPLQDFEFGMRQMMDDSEFLYRNIIKDIYWQGKVLGRKFRLLRTSYDLFMYGTVLSVLVYIISWLF